MFRYTEVTYQKLNKLNMVKIDMQDLKSNLVKVGY